MFSAAARNQLAWAIAGNDPAKNKTPFPLSSDDPNDFISHTSSGERFLGFIHILHILLLFIFLFIFEILHNLHVMLFFRIWYLAYVAYFAHFQHMHQRLKHTFFFFIFPDLFLDKPINF